MKNLGILLLLLFGILLLSLDLLLFSGLFHTLPAVLAFLFHVVLIAGAIWLVLYVFGLLQAIERR